MTRTIIDLKQNGLPGVFIEFTQPAKELLDMKKMYTPEECRVRADYLRPRCQSALPYIKRGESVMTEHRGMNKQEFDNDVANPETDTVAEDLRVDHTITVASLVVAGDTQ